MRKIPGYPKYQIAKTGEVYGLNLKKKSIAVKRGYKSVRLCKDGKATDHRLHRLLAIAYIPNPDNKEQVNHINGNHLDNRLDNLEWCTQTENIRHAVKHGLTEGPVNKRGEYIPDDTDNIFVQFEDTNYAVSNNGSVYNMNKDSFLKGHVHRGEKVYYLSVNGKKKRMMEKRLVALIYLPNPDDKPHVTHKNGDKLNNTVGNLRWVTVQDLSRERAKDQCVSVSQYDKQGNFIATYPSFKAAAEAAGVSVTCVREIARGLIKNTKKKYWWKLNE